MSGAPAREAGGTALRPEPEARQRELAAFADFRARIDAALDAVIPRGEPVALLHFPYDLNVGNHMMWVATTDYLAERRIPVAFAAHANNSDLAALRRAMGSGAILFLGGVTISRLWARHAEIKRRVAEAFPRNPLISLPATCLFVDDEDRREAATVFGTHPDVTVMLREPVSLAEARAAFPASVRTLEVPDLALRLAPSARVSPPEIDVSWLARVDPEASGFASPAELQAFDWPQDLRVAPDVYLALRASGLFSRVRSSSVGGGVPHRALDAPIVSLYRRASTGALRYGNRVLDRARVLVTDRMHPHMLAALRGQPVVLLPDRFGKNRAVFEAGTNRLGSVHWARDPAEALETARALAARSRETGASA